MADAFNVVPLTDDEPVVTRALSA